MSQLDMNEVPFAPVDLVKQVRAQRADYLRDVGLSPKLGDPHKEPPIVPPLNRNPRRHDIVAWRHDGRIESWKFETKEHALDHVRFLGWAVYYQWALMDGRDMLEKRFIAIPEGMGLTDDGMPYRI